MILLSVLTSLVSTNHGSTDQVLGSGVGCEVLAQAVCVKQAERKGGEGGADTLILLPGAVCKYFNILSIVI